MVFHRETPSTQIDVGELMSWYGIRTHTICGTEMQGCF